MRFLKSTALSRRLLASAGIDKKLSVRAQKIAALLEPAFETHLAAAKKQAADALRMTTAEKQARRAEREAELAAKILAWPTEIYGVLYGDPAWRFEVYSRDTGLDRDASKSLSGPGPREDQGARRRVLSPPPIACCGCGRLCRCSCRLARS